MEWDDYVKRTQDERFEKAIEAWARWVHNPAGCGPVSHLGYGNGHERMLSGPSTGKTGNPESIYSIEARIEGALWRYQKLDGFSKQAQHVDAFRYKYLTRLRDRDAADQVKVSVATYKRYIANVKAYLKGHLFDD